MQTVSLSVEGTIVPRIPRFRCAEHVHDAERLVSVR